MASFDVAFELTMGNEGGWTNNPNDPGGETYRGVARNFHPNWAGWSIIDAAKTQPNFPASLAANSELQILVKSFYKTEFWQRMKADQVANQAIANELFDTGVNMNILRAVTFLQRGLNALNRQGTAYADIVVDGKMGDGTITALNEYLQHDPAEFLLTLMNVMQGAHYLDQVEKKPTNEGFIRGWLRRVALPKT